MNVVVWNVDTQKDFMLSNGKLYIKDAEQILANLALVTKYAREENLKVVSTCDWHLETDAEISNSPDFKTTFPSHCIAGTEGAEFVGEVYPKTKDDNYYIVSKNLVEINEDVFNRARNIIIEKDKFDVFEGNKLTEKVLELLKPEVVAVVGVALDVCVKFAVLGLVKRGIKVVLLMDCCKALPTCDINSLVAELQPYASLIEISTLKELLE